MKTLDHLYTEGFQYTIVIIQIYLFYRKYLFISPSTYKKVSKTIQDCKG